MKPTLGDLRQMRVKHTPDTDTLSYTMYECYPDGKHAFAHVFCSLAGCRELIAALVTGSVFEIQIGLYYTVIARARFQKTGEGVKLLHLHKSREIITLWLGWCRVPFEA